MIRQFRKQCMHSLGDVWASFTGNYLHCKVKETQISKPCPLQCPFLLILREGEGKCLTSFFVALRPEIVDIKSEYLFFFFPHWIYLGSPAPLKMFYFQSAGIAFPAVLLNTRTTRTVETVSTSLTTDKHFGSFCVASLADCGSKDWGELGNQNRAK